MANSASSFTEFWAQISRTIQQNSRLKQANRNDKPVAELWPSSDGYDESQEVVHRGRGGRRHDTRDDSDQQLKSGDRTARLKQLMTLNEMYKNANKLFEKPAIARSATNCLSKDHNNHRRRQSGLCADSFTDTQDLAHHLKTRHPIDSQKSAADAVLTTDGGDNDDNEDREPLSCPVCGQRYNCRTRFAKHVSAHDESNRFPCSACDQTFAKEWTLEIHVNRDHKSVKPFVCDLCGQRFYANEKLLNHLSNKHKLPVYECPDCDYKTNSKYKMARHKQIHSTDRYRCDVDDCGLVFETRYNLTIHMSAHKKSDHLMDWSSDSSGNGTKQQIVCRKSGEILANNYNLRNYRKSMSSANGSAGHLVGDNCDKNDVIDDTLECNSDDIPVTDFLELNYTIEDMEVEDSGGKETGDEDNELSIDTTKCDKQLESDNGFNGRTQVVITNDNKLQKAINKSLHSRSVTKNIDSNNLPQMRQNSTYSNKRAQTSRTRPSNGQKNHRNYWPKIINSYEKRTNSSSDRQRQQFVCSVEECLKRFPSDHELRDHLKAVHKLFHCNKCEKCFRSLSGVIRHKKRCHASAQLIRCPFCTKNFYYKTSYEKHMRTHTEWDQLDGDRDVSDSNNATGDDVVDDTDDDRHHGIKGSVETYVCEQLDEKLVTKERLMKRMVSAHQTPANIFDYKAFNSKLLTTHVNRYSRPKPKKSTKIQRKFVNSLSPNGQLSADPISDNNDGNTGGQKSAYQKTLESIDELNSYCADNSYGVDNDDSCDDKEMTGAVDGGGSDDNGVDTGNSGVQNLLCFDCNHTFSSYDMLYKHNNQMHSKKHRPRIK